MQGKGYNFCLICLALLFLSSSPRLKALYNSIDSHSVAQYLAFYELYPNTAEGEQALKKAGILLFGDHTKQESEIIPLSFSSSFIGSLIALVNKQPHEKLPNFQEQDLQAIEKGASRLANRALKGYYAKSEQEVLLLSPDEIEVSHGLFLSQVAQGAMQMKELQTYEAILDLMALQILAKLDRVSTPEKKIEAINHFIFDEMGFRFPPHSAYAEKIDLFTLLPSVIDSRRGVCLGVSILYLCLAERLDLSLEVVTPPGHIYLRYRERNIETTARGIHLDSDSYLGVNSIALQLRNKKDVIGMAHFNQASTYWLSENYDKALASYQVAEKYLPEDLLVKEFMGYCYLLKGDVTKGKQYLKQIQSAPLEHTLFKEPLAQDFLNGKTDVQGVHTVFKSVDETRESLLKKKQALEENIKLYPQFRSGIFQLAATLIQLHRNGEALEVLKKYHDIESEDPTAEYYLSVLYAERLDYNQAWKHLHQLEKIMAKHSSKIVKNLRKEIAFCCPE